MKVLSLPLVFFPLLPWIIILYLSSDTLPLFLLQTYLPSLIVYLK